MTTPTQEYRAQHFDVWNEVPLVAQRTGMSCWAAAAAMLVGWRDVAPIEPDTIASAAPRGDAYARGLRPADVDDLAAAWGLAPLEVPRWTPTVLRDLLIKHGPLWVGEASPGLHAIVVTGVVGDGTPDGSRVRINDPWPIGQGERYSLSFSQFLRNFQAATDLAGHQPQILRAVGPRAAGALQTSSAVSLRNIRRSSAGLSPTFHEGAPMTTTLSRDAYGEAWAEPQSLLAADSAYISSANLHWDVLKEHGGEGRNLFVRWSEIPDKADTVDVVVYLHGYSESTKHGKEVILRDMVSEAHLDTTSPLPARSRPLVVIVPRGRYLGPTKKNPKMFAYSFPGLLANSGTGFQRLVDGALEWLAERMSRKQRGSLRIGRMILAGHSGAGAPIETLLGHRGKQRACRPDEVFLFDALYVDDAPKDGTAQLRGWLSERLAADGAALPASLPAAQVATRMREVGGALRILYRPGTATGSVLVGEALPARTDRRAPFYRAQQSIKGHDEIPGQYLLRLLADAGADVPDVKPGRFGGADDSVMDEGGESYGGWTDDWTSYGNGASDRDLAARYRTADDAFRTANADAVRRWILSADTSGIDLLPDEKQRAHFRTGVVWENQAFPGSEAYEARLTGHALKSNESRALVAAIAAAIPERRVPRTVRYRNVASEVVAIPKSGGMMLWPEARDAYVQMRAAAAADGVTLTISSSYRSEERQREIAAGNSNPNAVAQGISAHTYGLAIDFRMDVAGLRPSRRWTSPMSNLVLRYRSPSYKWLALNAHRFGFFPFRFEPWHWEYNPDGLAQRFARKVARPQAYEDDIEADPAYGDVGWAQRPQVCGLVGSMPRRVDLPVFLTCLTTVALREQTTWGTQVESDAARFNDLVKYRLGANKALDAATIEDLRSALSTHVTGNKAKATAPASVKSAVTEAKDDAADKSPWSAAFVCWVVRDALRRSGVVEHDTTRGWTFLPAPSHYRYAAWAAIQRARGDIGTGAFHAFGPTDLVLQPGDVIVNDRSPSKESYTDFLKTLVREVGGAVPAGATAATLETALAGRVGQGKPLNSNLSALMQHAENMKRSTHADIVTSVDTATGVAWTTGGNVHGKGTRVGSKTYPLDAAGRLNLGGQIKPTDGKASSAAEIITVLRMVPACRNPSPHGPPEPGEWEPRLGGEDPAYGAPLGLFHRFPAGTFDAYESTRGFGGAAEALAALPNLEPWAIDDPTEQARVWAQRRASFSDGVTPLNTAPFNVICRVEASHQAAATAMWRGTATFITDRWLITAGHVVVQGGSKIPTLTIRAGYEDRGRPTEVARYQVSAADVFVHPRFGAGNGFDIALIRVPRGAPGTPMARASGNMSPSSGIWVAGYAQMNPAPGKRLRMDRDTPRELLDANRRRATRDTPEDMFTYSLETRGGTSGSPIFYREKGQYRIFGVHVSDASDIPGLSTRRNVGVILTPAKLQWITEIIRSG